VVRGYVGAIARKRVAAFSDSQMRRIIEQSFGGRSFDDLRIPLAVAAVDMISAELEYLDGGSVAEAVLAASAIPTVLPPVRIGERMLADAGFVDNFGVVEALRRGARSIVLVDASVGQMERTPCSIPSMLDRANLVTRIHQRAQARAAAAAGGAGLAVLEVAGRGAVLDFSSAAEQLAYGRQVAERWLSRAETTPTITLTGRAASGDVAGLGALQPA
jgi:NTE family protein